MVGLAVCACVYCRSLTVPPLHVDIAVVAEYSEMESLLESLAESLTESSHTDPEAEGAGTVYGGVL